MISTKLEVEADFDDFMESETMSTTSESSVENQGGRNRGRTEPEKKMKKLRSIKLSRMSSARKGKSLPSQVHAGYAASSEKSTPMEMSDASPNHVKATSSSDGKEDNLPVLPLRLARRSSFKAVRAVTRKSSMKIRRSQLRKPSAGADLNKKLKIKHASSECSKSSRRGVNSKDDQHPIIPSSEAGSSPNFLKGTSPSDMKKEQLLASPSHSESSFDSSDQDKKISTNKIQKIAYPGNKSFRVSRTSTLGPMRILTKMASMKSKQPSMKKCSDVSSISDPSLDRATCSSTLKDSKFPDRLEVKPRGIDSDGTAVLNVCRYSYCSLHGHHHGNNPPLKRFVSMRRRVAKTQKSLKPESQSSGKAKRSGNRKKGLQTEKRVFDGDVGVALQQTTDDIRETPSVLGEDGSGFVSLGETVPGESSPPNPSHEGNVEGSGTGAEHFKEMSSNGEDQPIHIVGHSKSREVSLQEFGDPTEFDKMSLKPEKTMSTCNERGPLQEQAHRDANEDTASHLNLEANKGDSGKDVKNLETVSTEGSCELPNSLFSSASFAGMMENPTSAGPEKNEDSELEHRILQPEDTLVASTTDVAGKTEMENQKNFKFWKLIYQHMVTALDAEFETQKPLSRVDSDEQVQNLHKESSQDISQTDPVMSIEDYEARSQKLELTQSDAIKLVQQAFDKILSEIPDHSSDDQSSIASDIASDQDFLLEKQNEGKEVSISTSSSSREYYIVKDQEEEHLPTDNKIASGEVKAAEVKGKKSDKQMPNNWSNLKKIIILNRFVKSLEKLRNLKPRITRYLPAHEDPKAEKIHLKHQDMKRRKSSEEWMLDHALLQVISTLAPSQKRKVAMLVQAFESVTPLSENRNEMRPDAEASSRITSVPAYDEPSVHKVDNGQKVTGSEILRGKALNPEMSYQDNESHIAHQKFQKSPSEPTETSMLCDCTEELLCIAASDTSGTDMKNEDTGAVYDYNENGVSKIVLEDPQKLVDLPLSEPEERGVSSDKSLNDEDADRISQEKVFPLNEEVIERITKEEMPVLDSEVCSGVSEFNIKSMDLENHDLINSADHHIKTQSPTEVGERAQPKYKFLCSPLERSESSFTADVSKSERQKYTRLWYLIYKHMVSSNSTEGGLQPLQNGADEEVQGDDASKFSGENNADCQGTFAGGRDISSQNIEYHNNEIIKLVEEAIDEIPLPEIQDNASDNQTLNGDATLDQELPEKRYGKEEVQFISSSTGSANEDEDSRDAKIVTAELHSTLNSEEENLKSEIICTQNEAIRGTDEGNKSKKRVLRNWSNLKKLILLRRFVKALEKVRDFNPRGPRYLPLEPAPESEKVILRPQSMEDRKNAEEWMLDYALQRVVAKLTPERKRRVELLVEAFETVIPTLS